MKVDAVSLYRVTDTAPATGSSNNNLRTIPSGDDLEKRSLIRANGGVSKDGDTVTVSDEGVAKAVSSTALNLGISKDLNEMDRAFDRFKLLNETIKAVSSRNKAVENGNEAADNADRVSKAAEDRSEDNRRKVEITDQKERLEVEAREAEKPVRKEKEDIKANIRKEPTEQDKLEKTREEKARESKRREAERLNDLQTDKAENRRKEVRENRVEIREEKSDELRSENRDQYKVKFSFADSPYDVTSSVKEMEEDDSAVGTNRTEMNDREREEIAVRVSEVPETAEDNEEIENITVNLNSGYVAENDNSANIAAAENQTATDTVNENTANNRVIVQEVS